MNGDIDGRTSTGGNRGRRRCRKEKEEALGTYTRQSEYVSRRKKGRSGLACDATTSRLESDSWPASLCPPSLFSHPGRNMGSLS